MCGGRGKGQKQLLPCPSTLSSFTAITCLQIALNSNGLQLTLAGADVVLVGNASSYLAATSLQAPDILHSPCTRKVYAYVHALVGMARCEVNGMFLAINLL
jgi:hypothetical protein